MAKNQNSLKDISYEERRKEFFSQIKGGVAIVPAQPEIIRNDDVHFKFRQNSSFYYLTGFDEPDAIAVFKNIGGKCEYILYVRPRDLEKEIWDGRRAGVDGAIKKYHADKAYNVETFFEHTKDIFAGAERLYYTLNGRLDHKLMQMLDIYRKSLGRTGRGYLPLTDVNEVLGEMRIRKTAAEIDRLRKAGQITAAAHKEAMMRCRPGLYEYQIEALLEYCFRNAGSERVGYNSIVASGENATILHHVDNSRKFEDGDLLLIDAGAEFNYLTADITRVTPVNGKFSKEQKEIYEIVLDVQKACVDMAKPGATILQIHNFAVEKLTEAMIALKFLQGNKDDLIKTLAYKRFYPHGTGHLLGMDVHDIGLYYLNGVPRKLEEGMCFTIEPGFYVQPYDTSVPEKYRGIGVRIEDDVVLTESGCEVLTADVPKDVKEIEAITGSKPWLEF